MQRQRGNRGATLVDLNAVITSCVMLAAMFLPATQQANEAARRDACRNNMKQIGLALQNYADKTGSFPLVSTAPLDHDATVVSPSNVTSDDPSEWQLGDGYSWLFQILPEMEAQALYDRTRNTNGPEGSAKLRVGPVNPLVQYATGGSLTGQNNAAIQQPMEAYICPSYGGGQSTGATYNGRHAAVGNYVATPSTHYNSDGRGNAHDPDTTALLFTTGSQTGRPRIFLGNGALAFRPRPPEGISPTETRRRMRGTGFSHIRDGTTNTIFLTESIEQRWGSWMSGLSSYVVAVQPGTPQKVESVQLTQRFPELTLRGDDGAATNGQLALKTGNENNGETNDGDYVYMEDWPHADGELTARKYGPSSQHPGVVVHGFGDGHVTEIGNDIDLDVYLHLITRAGNDVIDRQK